MLHKNPYPSHFTRIGNNNILIDFSPYPKEKTTNVIPAMSDSQILNLFIEQQKNSWNQMQRKHSVLKSDKYSYYLVEVDNEISLLGIKGKNSYYLTYIRTENKDIGKEANNLIDFFQNKIITEKQK